MGVTLFERPRLGLIGLGAFGRLTARHLSPWFEIKAHDPAATDGEGFAALTDLATAAACPTVVLAVPVGVLAETVAAIAPHLTPGALILDVGQLIALGQARAETDRRAA